MRKLPTAFASAAGLLTMSTAAQAGQVQSIPQSDIAAFHCPAQWETFETLQPAAWANTSPVEIDPNIDAVTTEAFNKYGTAVAAFEDYFGAFF